MSVRTVRGGLLALLLPMTACVSGPDYHLPASAVAASPRAARAFVSGQEASFSHDAPPDRWWQLYGDPQLDAHVREALAANTDLRAADANLRRASATVLEYRARGSVQAEVDASGTLTHAGGYTQASAAPQS